MNTLLRATNLIGNNTNKTTVREIIDLIRDIKDHEPGIHLEFEQHFAQFLNVIQNNPDREELSPMFDPRYCSIGTDNGFWIKGVNENGEIVHLQAIRFNDLKQKSLSQHWMEHSMLYRPPGIQPDFKKTVFDRAPASHLITGKVCYHGELWMHKDFRGLHIASRLANLAMLLARVRFNPDFIYCLISPEIVRTGLSVRHGYLHMHPHGIQWHVQSETEIHEEYLIWMTAEELDQLMLRSSVVC